MPFPNGYKDKNGTYYVRYLFDSHARDRIRFLQRDIRVSLRTKNRRGATLKVRWFFFEMDCLIERIKSMNDQETQKDEFELKAAEIRRQLERGGDDLPAETAKKAADMLRDMQVKKSLSESQIEVARQLELDAMDRFKISEKQAKTLKHLADLKGVDIETELSISEEQALKSAERAEKLIQDIKDKSEKNAENAQRLEGEIPDYILNNMVEAEHRIAERGGYNEHLSVIAEDFFKNKNDARRNKKDRNALERQVTRFIELLEDPIARDLTTAMLLDARLKAKLLPSEQGKAVGKTANEMLELGLNRRSLQTTNNQLSAVRSFLSWAKSHRRIEHDDSGVIEDFPIDTKQEKSNRRSWRIDELQRIFNSYIYRYDRTSIGIKHGSQKINEGNFWIPLIALYTGARLEEICCLRPEHIIEIDSVWCFDMAEFDEDGKPIKKNESSVRLFPIHQKLIDHGLIEYAEQRSKKRKAMLFDLTRSSEKWSHSFSKWFNGTFKKAVQIKSDKNEVVFHSFRNNVVDEFEAAGVPEANYSRVTGHSTGGVARKTYAFRGEKIFPPKLLVEIVNTVNYEGLDLTHISFDGFKEKHMKHKRQARRRGK